RSQAIHAGIVCGGDVALPPISERGSRNDSPQFQLAICPWYTRAILVEGQVMKKLKRSPKRTRKADPNQWPSPEFAEFVREAVEDASDLGPAAQAHVLANCRLQADYPDRKSTRLNSSHQIISYAVF